MNFSTWRGRRYKAKRIVVVSEDCIEQNNTRHLVAMWVVRCKTTRNCLDFTGWDLLWWPRDGKRISPSRSGPSHVTMINRARERRRGAAATLARHNLFLLAAPRALKTLPKKSGEKMAGKPATGAGEETRPRELLPRRCHMNLIGHIAAKNVSRPHRSRELSISACSCTDACVARDVINISIFQRAAANGFH